MKFKVFISACLMSFVLASCSSSNSNPEGTTGSTDGDPFAGSTDSTTDTTGDTSGDPTDTDGTYAIDVELNPNQGPECEETDGQVTVNNNVITGTVFNPSDITDLAVTGNIEADGSISGGFALSGGAPYATYSGNVTSTGDLEGEWSDEFGCAGPWTAIKSL